jgi:diguanylate cyclase (GGDEF)-like protein
VIDSFPGEVHVPPAGQGSSSERGSEPADRNRRPLLLIGVVLTLASVYLSWRIPAGASVDTGHDGHILLLTGLISALFAIQNARLIPHQRLGWLLIGTGCAAWSLAYFLRASTDSRGVLAYTAAFLVSTTLLIAGCLRLAGVGSVRKNWRQLTIELVPPIAAVLTAAWLFEVGTFVRSGSVESHFRVAAALHGLAAVALIVVGIFGVVTWRQVRERPAVQSLMAGLVILSVADGLWLQRWIEQDATLGVAADVAFCIAFTTIAVGGLQAQIRLRRGWESAAQAPAVLPRPAQRSASISLLVLLAMAGGQAQWGELTAGGIEVATVAALFVVLFAMMWEDLVAQRETVLTEEIDLLSERIDGLISQVGRDPLTGLMNRRAFQERLEHEIRTGRRVGHSVAIALIDVDNFKQVNDTLGHGVGDQVLQAVASVLIGACRASDIAARYAGDEFVMILPGVDEETAGDISRRIGESVRRINDQLRPVAGLEVTLSIGVAVTYRCKRNVAQLVAIADAAMYDAKEGGKDQVVAVNADTLVSSSMWGVDPALSAEIKPWVVTGDRRGGAEQRHFG